MKHSLYIFNPEHDLALANDDPNFNPPISAQQLASDLQCLPLWYAGQLSSSVLCSTEIDNEWHNNIKKFFPQIANVELVKAAEDSETAIIEPWGWNRSVKKQLGASLNNPTSKLLPSEAQLIHIRQLSHRRTAIKALSYLHSTTSIELLPELPVELTNINDVVHFSSTHTPVVFKAPWSGSGKGLSWVRNKLTESHYGWCKNVIEKQGSVIGERTYNVIQNFALLFSCKNTNTSFEGYSLFETEKGTYRSNSLMSNQTIFNLLTENWISSQTLHNIRASLLQFIDNEIAPCYSGILGVDMFIYEENKQFKLHPCVEINMRTTMGYVARIFYDRFIHSESIGSFYIDHLPGKQELWNMHCQKEKSLPLTIESGKLISGYFNLTPVYPQSKYSVHVEINKL